MKKYKVGEKLTPITNPSDLHEILAIIPGNTPLPLYSLYLLQRVGNSTPTSRWWFTGKELGSIFKSIESCEKCGHII